MHQIEINGISISYDSFGQINISTPTVILLHGAGQSSLTWENQYDIFNSYDRFNFIALDLPGHGQSCGSGFKTIKEYSNFLEAFSSELNLKDLILVGHSMGGRIAQVYIINNPNYVIGCVLAGTKARIRVAKATFKAVQKNFDYFCKMATKNSFSEFAQAKTKENFYKRLRNSSQETCYNDLLACNEFDVTDDISKIDIPILIIAGEKDTLAPVKHSKHLNKNIDSSKLFVIKDAGHFMMIEKAEEFNKLIKDYLNFL